MLGSEMLAKPEWVFKERRLRSGIVKGRFSDCQGRNTEGEDVLETQGQRKKACKPCVEPGSLLIGCRDEDCRK